MGSYECQCTEGFFLSDNQHTCIHRSDGKTGTEYCEGGVFFQFLKMNHLREAKRTFRALFQGYVKLLGAYCSTFDKTQVLHCQKCFGFLGKWISLLEWLRDLPKPLFIIGDEKWLEIAGHLGACVNARSMQSFILAFEGFIVKHIFSDMLFFKYDSIGIDGIWVNGPWIQTCKRPPSPSSY